MTIKVFVGEEIIVNKSLSGELQSRDNTSIQEKSGRVGRLIFSERQLSKVHDSTSSR